MMAKDADLGTARLSYEPLGPAHARGLAGALCDPDVYRFIEMECPTPEELEVEWARLVDGVPSHRADEVWLDFAVRRNSDGVFIGRIEATVIGRNAEVAYLLGPAYWGQGFGRESLCWLHEILMRRFDVTTCWATINPANQRSLKLVAAMGYEEAPEALWPRLTSYDPGDRVFHKQLAEQDSAEP